MSDLSTLREQAKEHGIQIEAVCWVSVVDLAVRWGVSKKIVRDIPRAELPYLTLGGSVTRRYDPRDVERYESNTKHGSDTP